MARPLFLLEVKCVAVLDTEEAQAQFLLESIARFESGRKSLVDFRSAFFPTRKDAPPAKFHYRWSDYV